MKSSTLARRSPARLPRTHETIACRTPLAVLAAILVSTGTTDAQVPTIVLESVYPPSGRAGSEIEVEVKGRELDELERLHFSHPEITAERKTSEPDDFHPDPRPVERRFVVRVGENVPPGSYEARLVGRFGISNPRAFVVGDLPEVARDGNPKSREDAMPVEVGSVVHGRLPTAGIDHYAFELAAGDRVLIEGWGRRIDSRTRPSLRVFGPDGHQLRKVSGLRRDPLVDLRAKKAGRHVVAIFDQAYGGGDEYAYRLSIRRSPLVDYVFPPVGQPGSNEEFTVYGRNLPKGEPADGQRVAGIPLEKQSVRIPLYDGKSDPLPMSAAVHPRRVGNEGVAFHLDGPHGPSNAVVVHYAEAPVVVESEPDNDDPAKARTVDVPCEYVGRMYPANDRDHVQFEAKKGDVYWVEVESHRLGTPADPVFSIDRVTKNDDGEEQLKRIARVDDPSNGNNRRNNVPQALDLDSVDPSHRLVVAEDGVYRIAVRDLYENPMNDPRLVYRLKILREGPGFGLVANAPPSRDQRNRTAPAACVLRRGGTAAARVRVLRKSGFDGDVDVRVEGLPKGVTCRGATLGGEVDEGWLVFEAAPDAPAGAGSIRVLGKARIDGKDVEHEARYGTMLWNADNNTPVQSRLCRDLGLAVVAAETAPVSVTVGDGNVVETALGGKFEIPIKLDKRGELKGDVKVEPVDLPGNFRANAVTVKGDEGKIAFDVQRDDVPTGTYTFYLRGTTKFRYERNQDAIKRAEEEKKRLEALQKEWDEKLKQANTKRDEARKQADQAKQMEETAKKTLDDAERQAKETADRSQDAKKKLADAQKAAADDKENTGKQEAAKKAEQELAATKKAADEAAKALVEAKKAYTEARTKRETADATKTDAEKLAEEAEEKRKTVENLRKQAENDLKNAQNQNKPNDVNLEVVSTPVRVRIAEHPLRITLPENAGRVKQGESIKVPVKIERLYGFAADVQVEYDRPEGTKGTSAARLEIKKDQPQGELEIKVAADATPGPQTANLEFKLRFNNVSREIDQPLSFEVVEVEKKQE